MARLTRLEILINYPDGQTDGHKDMARSTQLVVLITEISRISSKVTCVSKYMARSTRLVMWLDRIV